MGITYGDHLIDSGYHDITPEQEREIEAREECARRGLDPNELCADGGIEAWMIVAKEIADGIRHCTSCKLLFRNGGTCPAIRGGCPMGGDF